MGSVRARRVLGVVVAILVMAGCTSGSKSATPPDGSAVADGTYSATIRRTTDGVPHIVAADWGSLSFGQGYASAEDRSCDLADQVIKIKGERAKWLGPGDHNANVDSDFSWKALGIYDRATKDYPSKSDEIHQLVGAFASGWNAYLAKVGSGGINGWCKGADWVQPVTGLDVYAYARAIALQASSGPACRRCPWLWRRGARPWRCRRGAGPTKPGGRWPGRRRRRRGR